MRPAEADRLHQDAVVVDTHNDLLMLVSRRAADAQAAYFRDHWLPQLRSGGVDVQVLPVFIDDDFRPEGAMRQTLRMIEAGHRIAEGNADSVRLCRTGADIDAALADGRIALVLALIGAGYGLLNVITFIAAGLLCLALQQAGVGAGSTRSWRRSRL